MIDLLVTLLFILLNGFFVAAEFALVKVRATQLDALVSQGNPTARMARHIVQHLNRYLSATQLGITLSSLALGYLGEPVVAELVRPLLKLIGLAEPAVVQSVSLTIGFVVVSYLHIVVGEVAPKSLAIARAESVSLFVAWPMQAIYYLFYPGLWLLSSSSNALLRLLGIAPAGGGHGITVTAEELYHITAASAAEGAIEQEQSELLTNVLSFSDRVAREIMVPRGRVVFMQASASLEDALAVVVKSGFTRFPLVEGTLDEVVGVLNQKDLIPYILQHKPAPNLKDLSRRIIYVPENMPAQKLLMEFQRRRTHFAVVVDEYGGLSGIVTLEDALEELVGEIQDEFDHEQQPVIKTDIGYSVEGGLLLSDLTELLEIETIESDADTVGGYVMERLNRIPEPGDIVEMEGWQLRVKAMDRMRVGRVEVEPIIEIEE